MLDPGHGGRDPGAVVRDPVRGEYTEARLVLPFAFAIGAELADIGHEIKFTRMVNNDLAPAVPDWGVGKGIDLRARSRMANEWPAGIYLSIHANANRSAGPNGAWVLHDDGTSEGDDLARAIFRELDKVAGLTDMDPEMEVYPDDSGWTGDRDLWVLGATDMPAVLIELGFLTNPEDLAQLARMETKLEVASAVAAGVIAWERARIV